MSKDVGQAKAAAEVLEFDPSASRPSASADVQCFTWGLRCIPPTKDRASRSGADEGSA